MREWSQKEVLHVHARWALYSTKCTTRRSIQSTRNWLNIGPWKCPFLRERAPILCTKSSKWSWIWTIPFFFFCSRFHRWLVSIRLISNENPSRQKVVMIVVDGTMQCKERRCTWIHRRWMWIGDEKHIPYMNAISTLNAIGDEKLIQHNIINYSVTRACACNKLCLYLYILMFLFASLGNEF
jgi:hypothetical protein